MVNFIVEVLQENGIPILSHTKLLKKKKTLIKMRDEVHSLRIKPKIIIIKIKGAYTCTKSEMNTIY